jgi:ATP-dependent RNA helicase RhlE
MNTFERLSLSQPILQALKNRGYSLPTPVQLKAIPLILEGRDIFGSAQTGTGKTAAFALPVLQLLSAKPGHARHARALVLAPTRELAEQISKSFSDYGRHLGLKQVVIYGGVSQHTQTNQLRKGVDIIIATPGRLLDLMEQRFVDLSYIQYFVLDEADRMLDMGFIHDIRRIASRIPSGRQTLLFSATMPEQIKKLASNLLRNPTSVAVKHEQIAADAIEQKVFFVQKSDKTALLCHLIESEKIEHALVFTRTKRGAEKLAKSLNRAGVSSQAIHGDRSQSQRQRALDAFKLRKINVLVATDVASRGIDVKELPFVVNFDLPEQAESYTHRIGRTGRAGAKGVAYSFCSNEEKGLLRDIQKVTSHKVKGQVMPLLKKESVTVLSAPDGKIKNSHHPAEY